MQSALRSRIFPLSFKGLMERLHTKRLPTILILFLLPDVGEFSVRGYPTKRLSK